MVIARRISPIFSRRLSDCSNLINTVPWIVVIQLVDVKMFGTRGKCGIVLAITSDMMHARYRGKVERPGESGDEICNISSDLSAYYGADALA